VAQLIIHRFEVIEVEENYGEGVPEPMKAADLLFCMLASRRGTTCICKVSVRMSNGMIEVSVRAKNIFDLLWCPSEAATRLLG
jgi:hypothetical protein